MLNRGDSVEYRGLGTRMQWRQRALYWVGDDDYRTWTEGFIHHNHTQGSTIAEKHAKEIQTPEITPDSLGPWMSSRRGMKFPLTVPPAPDSQTGRVSSDTQLHGRVIITNIIVSCKSKVLEEMISILDDGWSRVDHYKYIHTLNCHSMPSIWTILWINNIENNFLNGYWGNAQREQLYPWQYSPCLIQKTLVFLGGSATEHISSLVYYHRIWLLGHK